MTGRIITDYSTADPTPTGANQTGAPPPVAETVTTNTVQQLSSSATGLGGFAALGAFLLCLAISPQLNSTTFTPKFAVLLVFGAVGVVPLIRIVRMRSPLRVAAVAAVAFLAVGFVSALVSPSPNIGFFGLYLWGTGWLFWLGVVGAFAIGASLSSADRRWVFSGLLAGALVSAGIAIVQVVANVQSGAFALYDGTQADAALGNPIHLEALLLGGLALVLGRTCRNPLRWGIATLVLSVGLELTFERFALVIVLLLMLYALFAYGFRRGGWFALLVAGGYALAYATRGSGFGSRVSSGTADTTFGTRLRIWWAAAHYVLHHPLLGVGPGQLRTALDSSATLSFAQHVVADRVLTDGHDLFVEVAVTTGVVGLACFVIWLLGTFRAAAHNEFFGFALALIAINLVEPLNVAILPLALLALGAAAGERLIPGSRAAGVASGAVQVPPTEDPIRQIRERKLSPWGRATSGVLVLLALFVGVTMVIGDAYMFRGMHAPEGNPFEPSAARISTRFLPYWPDPALEIAQIDAFQAISTPAKSRRYLLDSRGWTERALSRDSHNPRIWTLLGQANVELKEYAVARSDYHHALLCERWYTEALQGLGGLASIRGQWSEAVHWYQLAVQSVGSNRTLLSPLEGLLTGAKRHLSAAAPTTSQT